jgi:hypothetical protein
MKYEVCPKSKYTDFLPYGLGMQHLIDVCRRVGNVLGCMYILVQNGSVESVMSYCSLYMVVFYNLCNICDAVMVLFTKNFYLQDRQLITPSTKMSWNDFENGFAGDWVMHHNNAPAHTALSISEFLAKKNIPTLPHPTAHI